jgi:hypothetical protein
VFIQQSVQSAVGLTQDIPKKLLADIAIGQRLEASVVKPALAGEMTTIKVADSSLSIRTPFDLQAGQKLQLEVVLEQGKLALKIVSLTLGSKTTVPLDSLPKNLSEKLNVKVGQQIAVEVVKILAENRLLVQTTVPSSGSPPTRPAVQQFDVDITQLSKNYKLGDKLLMDIVNAKPLSIQLHTEQAPSREQLIVDRLRQVLPQPLASAGLEKMLTAANKQQLPIPVQAAIQQLVENTLDKSAVTHTNALKQALSTSGVFTEGQLLKVPNAINQDFKVNVTRVLNILEGVIKQVQTESGDKPINKLPAQVLSALLAQGKSPAQLLNVLLSGKSPAANSVAQTVLSTITDQQQATALIQLLTKSLSQQQAILTTSRQAPLQLSELMALFKEVDSIHQKLQHNQLSMLKEPETSNVAASWLFDLPIKDKHNVDLLQIQIDQQKKQAEHDDESWQVQLCLDTQNLGAVQASVTLNGEDVKVVIRAERAESAQLLEENLPLLNATLAKLNVSVSHISCVCDEVKKTILSSHDNTGSTSLVDISV